MGKAKQNKTQNAKPAKVKTSITEFCSSNNNEKWLTICFFLFFSIRLQGLQEKTQKKTKSSSSLCPWLFGSFLLIAVISSLLAYDTHIHGGVFAKSATGKFLQQTGTLPYVEIAWTKTMSTSARGYQWAEKNVPVYVNQTCTAVKPYTAFLRDAGIVAWNFALERCEAVKLVILEKTPVVVNFVS